jgi:hypothetical protein
VKHPGRASNPRTLNGKPLSDFVVCELMYKLAFIEASEESRPALDFESFTFFLKWRMPLKALNL